MTAPKLKTERLLLRPWKEEDLPLFAAMNADPKAMEHFPSTLSQKESDELAAKIRKELKETDYGLWAVEVPGKALFIGFVGLHYQDFEASFTPCIEIGWRLNCEHWGRGYAFEAANKVKGYAFDTLNLPEIVSFTAKQNLRSIRLMEKLGMIRDPKEDFEHPKLPKGHPLRPHVLYRLISKKPT